ncbi:MAG: hypothetical protein KIT18_02520 [Burkholderiales bacterium]|nr:hypothetical protein [Burkholderiales bacterium]
MTDFDKRRTEFRDYLRTTRKAIDDFRFTDNAAVNHEVRLRVKKIKQLLYQLENSFYSASETQSDQIELRKEIQRWKSDTEKLLGVYPIAKRDQESREKQRARAKKDRKEKPSRTTLLKHRDEFERINATQWGWKADAVRVFKIDRSTLDKIIAD